MSDPNMFWFHCGRCGTLFQSTAGDRDDRLCPECGFDPRTGVLDAPVEAPLSAQVKTPDAESTSEHPGHRGKRSVKKRKGRHFMLKLVGGWTLLLAIIVLAVRLIVGGGEPQSKEPAANTDTKAPALTGEDINLLNTAGPKCTNAFSSYLAAGTPEERNQFVLNPVATASRMVRFYSLNPLTTIDPATLSSTGNAVLKLPGRKAIETRWTSQDGKKIDAVFLEENGEWRLDWDHYARYSDYPWSLFLAGSGAPVGEFRLLARERLAEARKDLETISLVLYAPRFGHPNETGFQSPEFLVSRSSRNGQLLDAAFKLARNHQQVFASKLPDLNPDGMIRVRVKIKRTEVEMERKFEIAEVIACHWFSVDDPGVEAARPAAENAKPN